MISICVPIHDMENSEFFLNRLKESAEKQTYKDWELVITKEGKMAENTNAAIKKAKGDIIKILFMDDYFADENALQHLADHFNRGWLVTGCIHDMDGQLMMPHLPAWNEDILEGINTIGSPSVMAFENKDPELFDEKMSWLLDCDYYHRMSERYGLPIMMKKFDVAIGLGKHQTTNKLSNEEKEAELTYLKNKYA